MSELEQIIEAYENTLNALKAERGETKVEAYAREIRLKEIVLAALKKEINPPPVFAVLTEWACNKSTTESDSTVYIFLRIRRPSKHSMKLFRQKKERE